jgi:hypothetical protein
MVAESVRYIAKKICAIKSYDFDACVDKTLHALRVPTDID